MEVVETWEGDITNLRELRHAIHQHFRHGASVECVADQGPAMKVARLLLTRSRLPRRFIFDASPGFARVGINFQNESSLVQIPLILVCWSLQSDLALSSSDDVDFRHRGLTIVVS